MPDFVNTTTLRLYRSVGEQPAGTVQITRAEYDAANAILLQYRKWTGSAVAEMSQSEKDAVDAAQIEAARDATANRVDNVDDELRASLLVILDEINLHATRITAILDAIDGAANLAGVKTAVGAIPDVPTRTIGQLKTALRGKLGS